MRDKTAIKNAMKSRGMTQKALAEKMGYNRQSSVAMLLSDTNGKSNRVDNLLHAMEALGYEIVIRDKFNGDEFCVITEED